MLLKHGAATVATIRDWISHDVRLQPLLSIGRAHLGSFDSPDERVDLSQRFVRALETATASLFYSPSCASAQSRRIADIGRSDRQRQADRAHHRHARRRVRSRQSAVGGA